MWLSLPALSSIMLMATTNQLCLDVAVTPLLWLLPMGLYLITYIICFHHERWYSRRLYGILLAASMVLTCVVLNRGIYIALPVQIASYCLTLFICCMVCHGELVHLKPGSRHLTSFYLMMSAGSAIGGIFVSLIAPHIFKAYLEFHLGAAGTALVFLIILFRDRSSRLFAGRPSWAWALLGISFLVLIAGLGIHVRSVLTGNVAAKRNFFGVLRILEDNRKDPSKHRTVLMHGRIEHGFQFQDADRRNWPVSYYGPDSGVGVAMTHHPRRREGALRIGVIGLGTGTMAIYGRQGDTIRFYEINPLVLELSDKYFTYRKDSPANIEVVLGDARVLMEVERQRGESQQFDVLVVDAFSSDAIPVHLLTRECFQTYRYHLQQDGILAVHITNRYFDLSPIVRNLIIPGPQQNLQALWFHDLGNGSLRTDRTDWVLMTANQQFLADPGVQDHVTPWNDPVPPPKFWTDDYSNLFCLIHERRNNQ